MGACLRAMRRRNSANNTQQEGLDMTARPERENVKKYVKKDDKKKREGEGGAEEEEGAGKVQESFNSDGDNDSMPALVPCSPRPRRARGVLLLEQLASSSGSEGFVQQHHDRERRSSGLSLSSSSCWFIEEPAVYKQPKNPPGSPRSLGSPVTPVSSESGDSALPESEKKAPGASKKKESWTIASEEEMSLVSLEKILPESEKKESLDSEKKESLDSEKKESLDSEKKESLDSEKKASLESSGKKEDSSPDEPELLSVFSWARSKLFERMGVDTSQNILKGAPKGEVEGCQEANRAADLNRNMLCEMMGLDPSQDLLKGIIVKDNVRRKSADCIIPLSTERPSVKRPKSSEGVNVLGLPRAAIHQQIMKEFFERRKSSGGVDMFVPPQRNLAGGDVTTSEDIPSCAFSLLDQDDQPVLKDFFARRKSSSSVDPLSPSWAQPAVAAAGRGQGAAIDPEGVEIAVEGACVTAAGDGESEV